MSNITKTLGVNPTLTSRPTFEEWYKTVPEGKRDTINYKLRRAYELAPQEELDAFATDLDAHLYSAYVNDQGVHEFMKSKDHPTINLELEWFNSDDAKEFRKEYKLDSVGNYYQYTPKFPIKGKINK